VPCASPPAASTPCSPSCTWRATWTRASSPCRHRGRAGDPAPLPGADPADAEARPLRAQPEGPEGRLPAGAAAAKITLAEIIRLIDGALAPTESVSKFFYESTPVEREKKLLGLFKEIRNYLAHKLEHTTLADVS
jgi:hypothetical protein